MSVKLKEATLRRDELLTADIRARGDIEITGSTPTGVRLAYLDAGGEPTQYRVSISHVDRGDSIPEEADHVLIADPKTAVILKEVDQ
jgi:hypothetical protein